VADNSTNGGAGIDTWYYRNASTFFQMSLSQSIPGFAYVTYSGGSGGYSTNPAISPPGPGGGGGGGYGNNVNTTGGTASFFAGGGGAAIFIDNTSYYTATAGSGGLYGGGGAAAAAIDNTGAAYTQYANAGSGRSGVVYVECVG
jgi:hypothetical protein